MAFMDRVATGQGVLLDGESGYKTAREGSRWYVTNPTVTTAVTAQTSFAATTPFLVFDTGTSTRMIPNSIILAQTGTVAGGTITVICAIDRANRYSSGGTGITPAQTNMELSGTTGVTVRHSATASAATAVRYFAAMTIPAVIGTTTQIQLADAYIIGASSSFLIYAYASTTGPSFFFNVEWVEERSSM